MSVDHAYTRCGEHALISCNHNSMHTTPHICEPRRELPPHDTASHGTPPRTAQYTTPHRTALARTRQYRSGGLMYRMVSPRGLSIVLIRMPPLSQSRSHPSPRLLPSRSAHHRARPHAPARASSCPPSRTPQRPTSRSRLCAPAHLTPALRPPRAMSNRSNCRCAAGEASGAHRTRSGTHPRRAATPSRRRCTRTSRSWSSTGRR